MSAAEFAFWEEFRRREGFPLDRLEWAIALAGAAVAQSQGAKVEPKDLIPRFTRRRLSASEIVAGFSGIPGVTIERKAKGE